MEALKATQNTLRAEKVLTYRFQREVSPNVSQPLTGNGPSKELSKRTSLNDT